MQNACLTIHEKINERKYFCALLIFSDALKKDDSRWNRKVAEKFTICTKSSFHSEFNRGPTN